MPTVALHIPAVLVHALPAVLANLDHHVPIPPQQQHEDYGCRLGKARRELLDKHLPKAAEKLGEIPLEEDRLCCCHGVRLRKHFAALLVQEEMIPPLLSNIY
jgi:hypothetical protein